MTEAGVLLIRHAETEANARGVLVGRGESVLTDTGRSQEDALLAMVGQWCPERVITSPSKRCAVFSRRAGASLGMEYTVDDRAREIDFGAADGLSVVEAQRRGVGLQYEDPDVPVARGGESLAQVVHRVDALTSAVIMQGGRSAIVTHGGIVRVTLARVLGLPLTAMWSFDVPCATWASIIVSDWGTATRWARLESLGHA